jgi:hypothetical protein
MKLITKLTDESYTANANAKVSADINLSSIMQTGYKLICARSYDISFGGNYPLALVVFQISENSVHMELRNCSSSSSYTFKIKLSMWCIANRYID